MERTWELVPGPCDDDGNMLQPSFYELHPISDDDTNRWSVHLVHGRGWMICNITGFAGGPYATSEEAQTTGSAMARLTE